MEFFHDITVYLIRWKHSIKIWHIRTAYPWHSVNYPEIHNTNNSLAWQSPQISSFHLPFLQVGWFFEFCKNTICITIAGGKINCYESSWYYIMYMPATTTSNYLCGYIFSPFVHLSAHLQLSDTGHITQRCIQNSMEKHYWCVWYKNTHYVFCCYINQRMVYSYRQCILHRSSCVRRSKYNSHIFSQ